MENMFDLMNDEVEVKDLPHALPYTDPRGTISVKNLTFEYNTGLPVIKNISFEIGNGQTVALVLFYLEIPRKNHKKINF